MIPYDDGRHDFDFLFGSWNLENRKLSEPLSGADDWTEFPSTARCWPLLDGLVNVDEVLIPGRPGGVTLRTFDTAAREWSINWVTGQAVLTAPPVVGVFHDGVGVFVGDDVHDGVPIRCRYTWTVHSRDSAEWEQAFSTDGERTWEPNWTNRLTRIPC